MICNNNLCLDLYSSYKMQNNFLNKEIMELNDLWKGVQQRGKMLHEKNIQLEARLCQVESKHLILLQEVAESVRAGHASSSQEVVSQLIEEAMEPNGVHSSANHIFYQVDQRVLKDLVLEKLPRLTSHFEHHHVDLSLITFNWFLVLFVDCVLPDLLFRIWDACLYEGSKVIFRYALAFFKYKEEDILKLENQGSILIYLRCFTRSFVDAKQLATIAFGDMNPFPMRQITQRRAFYLEKVRTELGELERIRQAFVRDRVDCHTDQGFLSDEDDDA
uniref:Rab-GAP TBC domain-containing protein n=1 Tax=Eptatretus burgeri TaxID=7764 RepID=A0A8C4NI63_EPTBU